MSTEAKIPRETSTMLVSGADLGTLTGEINKLELQGFAVNHYWVDFSRSDQTYYALVTLKLA